MTNANPVELTDTDIAKAYRLMTAKQRRKLNRMSTGLWKLLTSDTKFFATEDRYVRQALRSYWQTVFRVTRSAGPDYRVQWPGQKSWIRANASQYEQAGQLGYARRIAEGPFTAAGVEHVLTAA